MLTTKPDYSTPEIASISPSRPLLDSSGTSQKAFKSDIPKLSLKLELEEMRRKRENAKCIHDSPLVCVPPDGPNKGRVFQGCCNDWNCPRCGQIRANEEYGRICEGMRVLSEENDLWEITITCRGDISNEQAEETYLVATNRFLSTCRASAKKHSQPWYYVQVTERQKRRHPHSHVATTFCPPDAFCISDDYPRYVREVATLNEQLPVNMRFNPKSKSKVKKYEYFSGWLMLTAYRAGLGVQCHLGRIENVKTISMYYAKYLFKSAMQTRWSKGWKRVRYSHHWPRRDNSPDNGAFAILRQTDWNRLASYGSDVVVTDENIYLRCVLHGAYSVSPVMAVIRPLEELYESCRRIKLSRFGQL